MPLLSRILERRLRDAFDTVLPGADPVLRPSDRADFQANGAMAVAKAVGRTPRQVAEEVVAAASLDDICSEVDVSGPGFINLTLSDEFLSRQAAVLSADPRLGVEAVAAPERVVIDYSSPNMAKEMHVGHLRSTLIGDALARVLGFLGHEVARENHIGDWGTQFGMLIEHLLDLDGIANAESFGVRDLNEFYAAARRQFDSDPSFAERSRQRVVLLQTGDAETLRLWRRLVDESIAYFQEVYDQLGVLLTPDDVVGESYYNDLLPVVVSELTAAGLLVLSEGALCVFPPGFVNREGQPLPLIIQKSDGGYGYAASDLAALRDRFGRLEVDLAVYVVGAPVHRDEGAQSAGSELRAMYRSLAARTHATYIEAGASVLEHGNYTDTLPCLPIEAPDQGCRGGRIAVRASDGLHFCPLVLTTASGLACWCPVWSSGALRFGIAMATPVIAGLRSRESR